MQSSANPAPTIDQAKLLVFNGVDSLSWRTFTAAFIANRNWEETCSHAPHPLGLPSIGIFDDLVNAQQVTAAYDDIAIFILNSNNDSIACLDDAAETHCVGCSPGMLPYAIDQYLAASAPSAQECDAENPTDIGATMQALQRRGRDILQTMTRTSDATNPDHMHHYWSIQRVKNRLEEIYTRFDSIFKTGADDELCPQTLRQRNRMLKKLVEQAENHLDTLEQTG